MGPVEDQVVLGPDTFIYTAKSGLKELIDLRSGRVLSAQVERGGPLVPVVESRLSHVFDQSRADYIIQLVCEGQTLTAAALKAEVSMVTLMHWRARSGDFDGALRMAFRTRAEVKRDKIEDEIRHEIDKDAAPGKRVKIDALKWLAACDDKERFGTMKSEVSVTGAGVLLVDTGIRRPGDEGFVNVSEADVVRASRGVDDGGSVNGQGARAVEGEHGGASGADADGASAGRTGV